MPKTPCWSSVGTPVRLAIRRRSIRALRDLYADFAVPPALEESALPALDDALGEYARSRRLLGAARLREAAENIGCLVGEILVRRRGARWVTDGEEERLGLLAVERAEVAEPVAWALERAVGKGASLRERLESWLPGA